MTIVEVPTRASNRPGDQSHVADRYLIHRLGFPGATTTFRKATQISIELLEAVTGERLNAYREGIVGGTVAQRPVFLEALCDALETVSASPGVDAQVLIEAHECAEHGRFVEVMDLARSVSLSRLSVETTRTDRRAP